MVCCHRSHRIVGGLLVLGLMLAAMPTHAQMAADADRRAEEHLSRANKLFSQQDYHAAIDELRAGYTVSPQPRFLYALGQAYRFDHQCGEAVRAYRQFLIYQPGRSQIDATERAIKACGDADPSSIGNAPADAPTARVQPTLTPTNVAPPAAMVPVTISEAPAHRPIYKRWWLWTTVGGVVVVGLGVGLGVGLTRHPFSASLPPIGPGPNGAP